MNSNCQICQKAYEVTDVELSFFESISPVFGGKKYLLPPPRFCPACRQQRRLAYRNEKTLYKRNCDLCHKDMISTYKPESPFTVYCRDCWWSDQWDGLSFGQDFDFNRSFYEQYAEVLAKMPRLGVTNAQDQNSDYTNYGYRNKDCYLMFTSDQNQGCHYGTYVWNSVDCFDNFFVLYSELCYSCVDCVQCYGCSFCQECENCSDCFGCFDLKGCRNCFGSSGLRNKEFVFFNEQLSKEDYEARVQEAKQNWPALMERLKTVGQGTPRRNLFVVSSENAHGDHLKNCKNVAQCFDCQDFEEGMYCANVVAKSDHCFDMDGGGFTYWCYEVLSTGATASRCVGVEHTWNNGNDLLHCAFSMGSSDLFGCAGLHRKQYCILNKQYSKEDYETLAAKIVEHMQRTGEWGLFFPPALSAFAYNETAAQVYYPLTREQAISLGYKWDETVVSEHEGKPFNITKLEEEFYRKRGLPAPAQHPFVRLKKLLAKRNPRQLWQRNCGKCGTGMQSSYAPDRPEIVYCEKCYLESVY